MTDEEFDMLWTSCDWREEIETLRDELAAANRGAERNAIINRELAQELAALKQQMEKYSSNTANMLCELSKLYETFGIILTA